MTDTRRWTRCPVCGGSLSRQDEAVRCQVCGHAAYENPAPALCAFVIDPTGERFLLGRRARPPYEGLWDTLGGFAVDGEDALEGLRRELREETGAGDVEVLEFVGGFADRYGDDGDATLNFYWVARVSDGKRLQAADDVDALRWFDLEHPPSPSEIAFANTARALEVFLDRWRKPRGPVGMFEVQLVTNELGALAQFYGEVIRLRQTVGDVERGRVHFGLGRGQLILAASGGEEAAPGWPGLPPPLLVEADPRGPTPRAHGPVHFAIEVRLAHLFEEAARLERAELDVRGPFRWPDGYQSVYVRDPDGNVVELIAGP